MLFMTFRLRCASLFGVAAYAKNTPHFSGLARLASEDFYKLVNIFVIKMSLCTIRKSMM